VAAPRTGSTGVVEAKGDLLAFDGSDLERLAAGSNGSILRANSAQPQGLSWDPTDNIPGIGIPLFFGATFNALSQQGRYHELSGTADTANTAVLSAASQGIVLKSGTITRLGWVTSTATAATVYKVWINGVVMHTFALTGASGVLVGTFSALAQADLVAVEYDAGPFPGNSQVQIFIE
jgi:hypothetical protein